MTCLSPGAWANPHQNAIGIAPPSWRPQKETSLTAYALVCTFPFPFASTQCAARGALVTNMPQDTFTANTLCYP